MKNKLKLFVLWFWSSQNDINESHTFSLDMFIIFELLAIGKNLSRKISVYCCWASPSPNWFYGILKQRSNLNDNHEPCFLLSNHCCLLLLMLCTTSVLMPLKIHRTEKHYLDSFPFMTHIPSSMNCMQLYFRGVCFIGSWINNFVTCYCYCLNFDLIFSI